MSNNEYCNSCNSCNSCDSCDYCSRLRMTEFNLFCYSEKFNDENSFQQKRYRAFNKEVGEKRYNEILKAVKKIFSGLKLELKYKSWLEEWKKVTSEQWQNILKIPESDKEVIEAIVGFKLEINTQKTDLLNKADELIQKANELKEQANQL